MSQILKLTDEQVERLRPFFGRRESCFLVASIYADGAGWSLQVSAIPSERRLAVRAACAGTLQLPRAKKPKSAAV